jgi:hypothetical protein
MKIYRAFVRGSLFASKGREPTDEEVDACMHENAAKQFERQQVETLAPWMERFLENYGAYNRKKRAQAGAAKRWRTKE